MLKASPRLSHPTGNDACRPWYILLLYYTFHLRPTVFFFGQFILLIITLYTPYYCFQWYYMADDRQQDQ